MSGVGDRYSNPSYNNYRPYHHINSKIIAIALISFVLLLRVPISPVDSPLSASKTKSAKIF